MSKKFSPGTRVRFKKKPWVPGYLVGAEGVVCDESNATFTPATPGPNGEKFDPRFIFILVGENKVLSSAIAKQWYPYIGISKMIINSDVDILSYPTATASIPQQRFEEEKEDFLPGVKNLHSSNKCPSCKHIDGELVNGAYKCPACWLTW